jgi:hypothetical protein
MKQDNGRAIFMEAIFLSGGKWLGLGLSVFVVVVLVSSKKKWRNQRMKRLL